MFTWDESKRQSNLTKHDVDFTLAVAVDWALAVIEIDDRRDYGEVRANILAPIDVRLFNLVVTFRTTGPRLISLRKANMREFAKWRSSHDA